MEQKLRLCVFMVLIQVSLAAGQLVTVRRGLTVELSCPLTPHHNIVDWKNPEGYILFFKPSAGNVSVVLKNERYSISKLSESEITIRISDVDFKDGGNYTCCQYGDQVTERTVELRVLDNPTITQTQHGGGFDIKCTAEGNHHPPQIYWKFDDGPEFIGHSQVLQEEKKYVSKAMLHMQSVKSRVTVTCLVHHSARESQPLMDFVQIGQNSQSRFTTRSPGGVLRRTSAGRFPHGRTTRVTRVSPDDEPQTNKPGTFSGSDRETYDANNETSTTGWTSVNGTTEETTSFNNTEKNRTGSINELQTGSDGSSSLLVFLVTCLIFALLVVVIFFAIKLRRAHITWKRENEDSDPSEESSKSKSSQEEKSCQGQRRRGLFTTAFTQYDVEKPPVITSVINPAAMAATDCENKEQTSQPQTPGPTLANCEIRESEL